MKLIFIMFLLSIFVGPWAQALCVSANKANLRTGPGTKFQLSWAVGKYTPFVGIRRKGVWWQVKDQDGKKHWVHKSLVSRRTKCVGISRDRANVRIGPGTKFSKHSLGHIGRYNGVKILKSKGDWLNVADAFGERYWLHSSVTWRPLRAIKLNYSR